MASKPNTPPAVTVAWSEGGFAPDGTPTPGTCRCGCGAEVPAGARFRQGHDARAKGNAARAAVAGATVRLVRDGAVVADSPDPAVWVAAGLAAGCLPVGTPASVAGGLARAADAAERAKARAADKAKRDAAAAKAAKAKAS